jgi:pimeloyl-ACP methyl ester carboxylesterase
VSFDDAGRMLRGLFASQFPALTDDDWTAFARRTFKQAGGRIVADYDVKLTATLAAVDLEHPLPELWNQFDALARMPVMVIRGGNSDILSAATVEAMRARHPALELVEVADQGHAPLLMEADVIARIAAFVAGCEGPGPTTS